MPELPSHGVWESTIGDQGAELLQYLQQNWKEDGEGLPVPGCASVCPYADYEWTSDTYSRDMQLKHTIRVRHDKRRLEKLFTNLPGLDAVYSAILPAVHAVTAKWFAVKPDDVELYVWHAIRQFYEADGGCGVWSPPRQC